MIESSIEAVVVGLLVGSVVSLTGIGTGVLLLPLLILWLGVPPLVAVGSAAVFSALTRVSASVLHWRQKNIDRHLAGYLALGSVPAALGGVWLLAFLRADYGEGVNQILSRLIGVLLIAIPLVLLFEEVAGKNLGSLSSVLVRLKGRHLLGAVLTGVAGGFLVGLTAVGSGSIFLMLLFLFYPVPAKKLVGTVILHGVILTGVVGLAHLGLGTVDPVLVGWLLVGSLPGVFLGSRLIAHLPIRPFRQVLLVLILLSGVWIL